MSSICRFAWSRSSCSTLASRSERVRSVSASAVSVPSLSAASFAARRSSSACSCSVCAIDSSAAALTAVSSGDSIPFAVRYSERDVAPAVCVTSSPAHNAPRAKALILCVFCFISIFSFYTLKVQDLPVSPLPVWTPILWYLVARSLSQRHAPIAGP